MGFLTASGSFVYSQIPTPILERHPRFVSLLNYYYTWFHRVNGMTDKEIEDLQTNFQNVLDKKASQYILKGDSPTLANFNALLDIKEYKPPGFFNDHLSPYFNAEREFGAFELSKGELLYLSDGSYFFVSQDKIDDVMGALYSKYGYKEFMKFDKELDTPDSILHYRVLKYLFAARGTLKCLELFFLYYFGEKVEIVNPKEKIAAIDANFVIDGTTVIRDDDIYQEYSYIVYVKDDPEKYQTFLQSVYYKYFHPSGFKLTVLQKQPV